MSTSSPYTVVSPRMLFDRVCVWERENEKLPNCNWHTLHSGRAWPQGDPASGALIFQHGTLHLSAPPVWVFKMGQSNCATLMQMILQLLGEEVLSTLNENTIVLELWAENQTGLFSPANLRVQRQTITHPHNCTEGDPNSMSSWGKIKLRAGTWTYVNQQTTILFRQD